MGSTCPESWTQGSISKNGRPAAGRLWRDYRLLPGVWWGTVKDLQPCPNVMRMVDFLFARKFHSWSGEAAVGPKLKSLKCRTLLLASVNIQSMCWESFSRSSAWHACHRQPYPVSHNKESHGVLEPTRCFRYGYRRPSYAIWLKSRLKFRRDVVYKTRWEVKFVRKNKSTSLVTLR